MCESSMIVEELDLFIDSLHKWMKPQSIKKDLLNLLNTIYLKPEPHGVVAVLGTWNYPFQTSLLPVIGAIAAGNNAKKKIILHEKFSLNFLNLSKDCAVM